MLAGRDEQVYTVEAQAAQWQWSFRYPDRRAGTQGVLHIPAGEPVDVAITSLDVIHGFWVPRLAGKVDAIPGTTNTLRIFAPEPGIYEGMCAEFCGLEHATMAVRAEVLGEKPNSMVRAVLERQAQLIKSDVTHRNWQIAREAAGAALMILAAISAFTAVIIVAGVLWTATQYRGLTILPFSVPPALEERGLTGAAVASRVLDRLAEMQTVTQSMRAANTYADSWGDEVAVEIPQTGVSAGELWRFLRSWLGEEIRITGELVRDGDGYRVTARAGGQPARVIMHLAEQTGEVDEVLAAYGARPTEWLLANADVDPRWCLIHCTQMNDAETRALARTGAAAGLCPITEANLGDGIFNGTAWSRCSAPCHWQNQK